VGFFQLKVSPLT